MKCGSLPQRLGAVIPFTVTAATRSKTKSKDIPVTGRGGLQGCEMLKIPHCLDNRLIGGCKVVSLTHRSHSTHLKKCLCFWHFFLLEAK
jgi:hypothetical protein